MKSQPKKPEGYSTNLMIGAAVGTVVVLAAIAAAAFFSPTVKQMMGGNKSAAQGRYDLICATL